MFNTTKLIHTVEEQYLALYLLLTQIDLYTDQILPARDMLKVAVLALCLTVAWSLQCYQCDTKEDVVTGCSTSVCNG